MNEYKPFTQAVIESIRMIPQGKVSTYGDIATFAGSPRGARQVVRILHTLSEKEHLPWHRIVNKDGKVVVQGDSAFEQILLLENEGVEFLHEGTVDLERHRYKNEI